MKRKLIWIYFFLLFVYFAPLLNAQVPDRRVDVQRIAQGRDLTTHAGSGCFTEQVAFELHQIDKRWGHLKKRPGQNNFNGHAVDAILWIDTGQSIDIVGSSASPKARPSWTVDIPRYTADDWQTPKAGCGASVPPPVDPLDPPSPPFDPAPLIHRLDTLDAAFAELRALLGQVHTQLGNEAEARVNGDAALREDLNVLAAKPIPAVCAARGPLGIPIRCELR